MSELIDALRLSFYPSVDSTNNHVKAAIKNHEAEGFCVASFKQTHGYGRQGRTWESPAGGLYFSLLLRPQVSLERLPSLALVTALSLRTALVRVFSIDEETLQIKWPNDVVVPCGEGYKKLCGISLELIDDAVCVGIGINLCEPPQKIETDGRYVAAFIEDLSSVAIDLSETFATSLIRSIVSTISKYYSNWQRIGFSCILEEYNRASFVQGKEITVTNILDDVCFSGCVLGVDELGRLVLQQENGELLSLCSGEVHIC